MATYLIFVLSTVLLVNGASINRVPDSYEPFPDIEDDIINNVIPTDEEGGDIEGLLPPKITAQDYYQLKAASADAYRNSSYELDTENKQIRLKDDSTVPENNEKNEDEAAIKEISDVLSKLLVDASETPANNDSSVWTNFRPVVTLTHDGITLEFSGKDEKSEINVRESTTPSPEEDTTLSFEDVPQGDEPREDSDDSSSLFEFFQTVWGIVRSSVDYASNLFGGLVRPAKNETEPVTPEPVPTSSVSAIVAFEEPLATHQFPSREFEKGGRDIDSLLYGRGIA